MKRNVPLKAASRKDTLASSTHGSHGWMLMPYLRDKAWPTIAGGICTSIKMSVLSSAEKIALLSQPRRPLRTTDAASFAAAPVARKAQSTARAHNSAPKCSRCPARLIASARSSFSGGSRYASDAGAGAGA